MFVCFVIHIQKCIYNENIVKTAVILSYRPLKNYAMCIL